MKNLYYRQQRERSTTSGHISHGALFLFFYLIVALEFSRAAPFEEGANLSRNIAETSKAKPLPLHPTGAAENVETTASLSRDENAAREEAQSYLHGTHGEEETTSPRKQDPKIFKLPPDDEHEVNEALHSEKEPPHDESSGNPKGNPNSPHEEGPRTLPHESPDARNRRWFVSFFSKLWEWLFKSRAGPKRGGPKLPIKDHLREPMKGVWHRSAAFRFSPRPPTDKQDEEITTLEMLGKELLENEEKAAQKWEQKLTEIKAVPLRRRVLSTRLFFQLVKDYRGQAVLATHYQKLIQQMGEELVQVFDDENIVKELFKEIEAKFKEYNHGMIGTKYDLEFYKKPLSPLLLLAGEEGKKFQGYLAEKNVINGYFEKSGIAKIDYLAEEARKYHSFVEHFKKTTDTQDALKHYLEESRKLHMGHQRHEERIVDYFEHLDKNRHGDFLQEINKSNIEYDDVVRNQMGGFAP